MSKHKIHWPRHSTGAGTFSTVTMAPAIDQERKVVLGYPIGGSGTAPFIASMEKLTVYELMKPFQERLLAQKTYSQGLYVSTNRNLITERFLSTEAKWLLQVDTDIEFPPTIIETMLALCGKDKKILAASVPLGAYESCAFVYTSTPGIWQPVFPVPQEPMEVEGIATACVLIHRDVFEKIAQTYGQVWFHHIYIPAFQEDTPMKDRSYREQGEDLAFSLRAKDVGFAIWCAHIPGLKHFKTRGLTHDDLPAEVVEVSA